MSKQEFPSLHGEKFHSHNIMQPRHDSNIAKKPTDDRKTATGCSEHHIKVLKEQLTETNRQLQKAMESIKRRDERIKRRDKTIKDFAGAKPVMGDHENAYSKLLDKLIKCHFASMIERKAPTEPPESMHKEFESLLVSTEPESDLTSLHDRMIAVLTQLDSRNSKLSAEKAKHTDQRREERAQWERERTRLERRVKELKEETNRSEMTRELLDIEMEGLKKACQDFKEALAQRTSEKEVLQGQLQESAIAYFALHHGTVNRGLYQELEEQHLLAKRETSEWRYKAESTSLDFKRKRQEAQQLGERLKLAEREIRSCQSIIDDLRQDRQALRSEMAILICPLRNGFSVDYNVDRLPELSNPKPFYQLALDHTSLSVSHLTYQIDACASFNVSLIADLSSTSFSLFACQASLVELKLEHASLQSRHMELEKAHVPCASIRSQLNEAEKECLFKGQKVEGLEEEIARMEMRVTEDGQKLKKANETVVRAKMAEKALEEEVEHFREAYLEAAGYEVVFNDLQEQHDIMISREEAAVEEAEKLATHNAELAGHTNEVQKIKYVESLRREMLMVKQELASTRHLLNNANDKINSLRSEISAYTSIDTGVDTLRSSGSARTRVSRRQPEGGRLTVSRVGRSISGPSR